MATIAAGVAVAPTLTATAEHGNTSVTNFGMRASAFGTRVKGGDVPANSGRTALAYLGCTKLAGRHMHNHLAQVRPGDTGDVEGIDSVVKTYRKDGGVHVRAVNKVASAEFSDGAGNTLKINGMKAVAHSWHDATGFHRATSSRIASIELNGEVLPVPAEGDSLVTPVATVTVLSDRGKAGPHQAKAEARVVKLELHPSGTVVLIGASFTQIMDRVPTGILGGQGRAADGSVFDGTATTGKIPVQVLPCRGTNGNWLTNKTAGVTVPDVAHLGAMTASARGNQRDLSHGYGQTRGRVARATLGPDQDLVIKGVVGAANVKKRGDRLIKTIKGTTVGSITFQGQEQAFPTQQDPLEFPGLAILYAPIVDKTKYGIKVIAMKVTLFPGTGGETELNLGRARAKLKPR